jgi:hypothetical protein
MVGFRHDPACGGSTGTLAAAGLTHVPTAHIAVRPSTGSPGTTFLVNFRAPQRTGRQGVRTFKTTGLASHGTFFLIVRARDEAGNEDQNREERRGADPCL